ncbi:hypothetical protein FRX31_026089 [Thalictrum thalictroides]|uniref:Uncharacterized protein n=1 Tax=Thalictrum thalictroides TaxID=46969 RepID=A0A7J6VGT6_THATH|nr:hypothetical protein FRX31_026089 [Thalictrum thalictroides]
MELITWEWCFHDQMYEELITHGEVGISMLPADCADLKNSEVLNPEWLNLITCYSLSRIKTS